ncbi:DUF4347 domain-containing protein [Marinobacter xestospongiae]|uniref:DUF4347 domain-containing protein n=1 Tax=Marinobacter xestospongiae TaxID=994319 RepID=A0ABU3W229_9GAMM|nr:DUF4347 domain-containing protein [Marinobacter xestospongiae]MDV2080574.1 DUF4347 domain-containing protein [Marinobacter xestospongiae]
MLYRHVTVIDPVLPDAQTLVDAAHQLGHTALILTQDEASLPSLVQRLENLGRVDALHVLCHGEPGQVRLGNTLVSPANIDALAPSLQRLGACVEEAILLYSCHTASGPQGQELLARLGNLLGTTVSASSTAIGHSTLGGNWILDQSTGPHSAQALSIPDYAGVLATTLTFSADESGWDAQAIAVDGEGGSTDFPGMELQIFNISDAAGTKLDHINWYGADTFYADDGFHGVTIDWDNHSGEWAGMAIQSADGAEFQLQSFDFYDWGSYPRQGENVTVIGYRDNVQVGSQTFTSNGDDNRKSIAITPSTGFEAVDEVRIVFEDGAGYIALNNITVDIAIPPNTAPTASDDNLSIRYNSSHTFVLADFGFSDVDGDTLHHVTINTVPTSGSLTLDGNPVNNGDTISAMDLSDGKLVYSPASGASGNGYASLVFTVNDGTVDAAGSNTLTLDVGTPPPPPPPPTPDPEPEPEPEPDPEPDPEPEPEPQPDPDTDGDGVPQDEEAGVPSLNGDGVGDGNGDGIADTEQGNVASLIFLESDRAESDPDGVPEIYLTLAAVSA